MTLLALPSLDHYESWAACVAEFEGTTTDRHGDCHWYLPEGLRTRTDRETYEVYLGLLRREGHASRAVGLAPERCRELGIDRVLMTCDEENAVSARTIENNGGVLADVRAGIRRYWIEMT